MSEEKRMDGIAGALAIKWKDQMNTGIDIFSFDQIRICRSELMQAFGLSDENSEPTKGKEKGQL